MEEKTCMEYLFQSVQESHFNNINQDILFNASNEFRNVWNLVKKLQDLARVDVRKITRFLDAVQEALEKKTWSVASRQCLQAENEYRQIRRYIRPSFLDDFKVSLYIENVNTSGMSKSGRKKEKKPPSPSVSVHHRQSFRNKQINKQKPIGDTSGALVKKPDKTKTYVMKQKEMDNKYKSALHTKENSFESSQSSNLKRKAMEEISSRHTLKGDKNNIDYKESSVVNGKAIVEISSKEASEVKETAVNEISSENAEKTNVILNTDITKDASENPNAGNKLVSNEDMSHIIKTDHQNGKVSEPRNDSDSNLKTESQPESNGQKDEVKSVSKMTCSNDKTGEKEVDGNFSEGKKQRNDSFHETDKELEKIDVDDDMQEMMVHNVENTNLATGLSDAHSSVNDGVVQKGTINGDGRLGDQISSADKSQEKFNPETNGISNLLSERTTEIGYECKEEEIVTELNHVYDTDWGLAYKALTGCQPSNGIKNTIDFLGEILKLSAEDVKKTAVLKSTCPNNTPTSTVAESLQNLKQEFLTRHLKKLQREHSVEYHNGSEDEYIVNLYSAKCVELSWFMFTRKPPMVFDYDSRPMVLEDLLEIFKPYKNEGHCIHYVVWPAIRHCQGGRVVSQGIAEFR